MASTRIEISVSLEDYFSKWSFNDGSDEWVGNEYIDTALEILNKHLKKYGITAEKSDCLSSHNNCRIAFYNSKGEIEIGIENSKEIFSTDAWTGVIPVESATVTASLIAEAVKGAAKEFDEEVTDDLTRVLKTPDEERALLVGQLTDREAINVMKNRLKSILIKDIRKTADKALTVMDFIKNLRRILKLKE